jgi:sugar phosphate isomerase/epimerase
VAIASESSPRPARRELLKCLPAALSVGFFPRLLPANRPQTPSLDFPTQARARLAVTSYPFRAFINSPTNRGRNPGVPGIDLTEFPAFVAEKFEVANVNPLLDHFSSTDRAYIDTFRAALDKARTRIVDLGLAGKRFYAADSTIRRDAVVFGKKSVEIAVQIGSPSVRQHVAGHNGEKPDVARAAESLGELAEHGAKRNIVINLENDSPGAEDPFFLVAVIEKVNSPYLRALPDFGNSLIGHDDKYNQNAVKAMLEHAFNMCHVKDTVQGHDGKQYQVDLKSMFELARAISYRGFFSMEFDTAGGDPIAGTKRLVEKTLQHLS